MASAKNEAQLSEKKNKVVAKASKKKVVKPLVQAPEEDGLLSMDTYEAERKPGKSFRRAPVKPTNRPLGKVKVVGIGGGGGNAVDRMSEDFIRGVEFIAINTDAQDLDYVNAKQKIYVGKNLTRGLGTGMSPELGRQAAEENRSEIAAALEGADLVFITAGMGGGTGTGASPVVAEIAKQSGALTVAVITKPFTFEGSQRMKIAQEGILKLKEKVDAMIVVHNDKIFSVISKDASILKAFESVDDVLRNAIRGIVEIVAMPGIVNIDFADVRVILQDAGLAVIGLGHGGGNDRSVKAVTESVNSPLLDLSIEGAKGVIWSVSGNRDLKMTEINNIAKVISESVDPSAKIIFGAYHDRRMKPGQLRVTVVATGFSGNRPTSSLFDTASSSRTTLSNNGFGNLNSVAIKEKTENSTAGERPLNNPVVRETQPVNSKEDDDSNDDDKLDIPTFLRKIRR